MISVIIPVYNVKPYLEAAVDSVLRQSYKDIEVVLIDDGSTDGSSEICDAYLLKDKRIKVFHQENKGLSAARNTGLDFCLGERILFLDSDDALCRDALLKMSAAMDTTGADIVDCDFAAFDEQELPDESRIAQKAEKRGKEKDRTGLYTKKEAFAMQLSGQLKTAVWGKLCKRSIWKKLRFSEGRNFEDFDIIMPLIGEAESLYILDEKCVMYRRRKGSITTTYDFKNLEDFNFASLHYTGYIAENTPEYFKDRIYHEQLERRLKRLLLRYYFYVRFAKQERKRCLAYLQKAIRDTEKEIGIRHCKRKVRLVYALYRYLPPFVYRIVYGMIRGCNQAGKRLQSK